MDVTKPCEFIGFGAMDVTKPYEFMGFVVIQIFWTFETAATLGWPHQEIARKRCSMHLSTARPTGGGHATRLS